MTYDDINEFIKELSIEIPNLCNYELLNQQIMNLTKSLEIQQNIAQLKCQGKFYFIIGKYEQALVDFTSLLEFESMDPFALRYRGETYHIMEKYEESLADLNKLLEINNNIWVYESYEEIVRK